MNNTIKLYSKAKRIIRCLFVIWIFVITQAIGQSFPPKFRSNSQEQGLCNNAVRFIYQDKSGFIWIATRSAFYRKLQALTNLSPIDFIHEMRMKWAAQLLQNQELNVSEVAYAVGYNDLKTFRQNFQHRFAVSPSQFVKKKSN